MVRNSKKIMMFFGALTVGLLCVFFINQESLAADITKLSMTFITKTNLNVNQMDRNFTVFTIKNNYGQRVYYAKIKNSEIAGINVVFSPSEVIEFETNMTITVMMGIYANQSVVNGTYQIRVWAESRDVNWNNIKSPNYYINLTIFSNYTVPSTTSTTTSTTTSVYTTTTEKSFFPNVNNTFSKTIGKNISKNQILIIVAIIMIVIVLIPTLSFKKEPSGIVASESKEKTSNEEK